MAGFLIDGGRADAAEAQQRVASAAAAGGCGCLRLHAWRLQWDGVKYVAPPPWLLHRDLLERC